MLQTIYVGRLDAEKGIKELIASYAMMLTQGYNISIDIYGDGSLHSNVKELAHQFPDNVRYHGRQHKKDILTARKKADYFVMPSQFLETFGLTACESLLLGTPVIATKKGGLIPFVDPVLDIGAYPGTADDEKLINLFQHLINKRIKKNTFHKLIKNTQQHYSKEIRYDKLSRALLPQNNKTTLLVSDYISYKAGGVETHLHDSAQILENHSHKTITYGHQNPQDPHKTLKKFWTFFRSGCNIKDALKLRKLSKQHKIGLIWRHSISRAVGRLPMTLLSNTTTHQAMTHHELGLFHPYPSRVTHVGQIPHAWSLWSWIKAAQTKNPFKIIGVVGKYCYNRCIHQTITKTITQHIVPSERMVDMVQSRYPNAKVICVPHFVDIAS